jgi:hypothetical protein
MVSVAGLAITLILVFIVNALPVGGISVAENTGAGIVIRGCLGLVTGEALVDAFVVKLERCPIVDAVAVVTLARKVLGVGGVGVEILGIEADRQIVAIAGDRLELVTATTIGGDVSVGTGEVAILAPDVGVASGEGIAVVINLAIEEGDRNGGNLAADDNGKFFLGISSLEIRDQAGQADPERIVGGELESGDDDLGAVEELIQSQQEMILGKNRGLGDAVNGSAEGILKVVGCGRDHCGGL